MENKRQNWVDIAKAFAIISVVLGHVHFDYPQLTLLPFVTLTSGLWHVPVFFMIGGFFLTESKLADPKSFIKGKFLKLYLPIIAIYLPAVLLHNWFLDIGFYSQEIDYSGKTMSYWDLKGYAVNIVKCVLCAGREPVMGAMWFAYVLFMALCMMSILYWICAKISQKNTLQLFALSLLVFAVISSIFTNKFDITIPRCSNVFTAAWLIFVGMTLRQRLDFQFDNKFHFAVALVVFYSFGVLRGGVSLNHNQFDDIGSLTLSTVSALYVVCFVSKKIDGAAGNFLAFVGRESFAIMGLHFIAFKVLSLVLNYFGGEFDPALLSPYAGRNVFLLMYFLVGGVLLPLLCVYGYRKCIEYFKHKSSNSR